MNAVVQMEAEAARALTDQIKVAVEATWELVKRAYVERAWASLGYDGWDDYCTREFGTSRIRLPREERAEVVASLRESGLSTRAIAAATGLSQKTVSREVAAGESNDSPVIGTDGKRYAVADRRGASSDVPETYSPKPPSTPAPRQPPPVYEGTEDDYPDEEDIWDDEAQIPGTPLEPRSDQTARRHKLTSGEILEELWVLRKKALAIHLDIACLRFCDLTKDDLATAMGYIDNLTKSSQDMKEIANEEWNEENQV